MGRIGVSAIAQMIEMHHLSDSPEALLAESDAGAELSVDRVAGIIEEKDLKVVSDTGALEGIINTVVERNQKAVEDFKNGKQAAVGALIGQVMREVKGADAKVVRQMLMDRMKQ